LEPDWPHTSRARTVSIPCFQDARVYEVSGAAKELKLKPANCHAGMGEGSGRKTKRKLEKARGAARQQVGKLYIIAACLALLVCGCRSSSSHTKRTCIYPVCTGWYAHIYAALLFDLFLERCSVVAYV